MGCRNFNGISIRWRYVCWKQDTCRRLHRLRRKGTARLMSGGIGTLLHRGEHGRSKGRVEARGTLWDSKIFCTAAPLCMFMVVRPTSASQCQGAEAQVFFFFIQSEQQKDRFDVTETHSLAKGSSCVRFDAHLFEDNQCSSTTAHRRNFEAT